MSNELAVLLQNNPGLVVTGDLDEDTLAVAGGAGVGNNKRISIAGGVFRKYAGGKEIAAIEDRHMNVIFVKMAHDPSRTFYAQAYKEGEKIAPACWSSNSKTPDAEVKEPMGSSCDQCAKSVKGSGTNGQGTACRISWRTAVVLPNDPSGDVMQLVLPATSAFGKEENGRWPFKAYITMLANNNVASGRVVTRMSFDTNTKWAKVLFSPAGAVDPEMYETIKKQNKSSAAEAAIKLTVYQQDSDSPEPAQPAVASAPEAEEGDAPTLRESTKKVEKTESDVSDIVKKWSKK